MNLQRNQLEIGGIYEFIWVKGHLNETDSRYVVKVIKILEGIIIYTIITTNEPIVKPGTSFSISQDPGNIIDEYTNPKITKL